MVEDQRAATIHPPTLEMLDDLGITERIMPLGLQSAVVRHWDRVTGEVIADFDMEVLSEDTRYPYVLQYEHYKLVRLVHGLLERRPASRSDEFGATVVDVDNSETPSVTVRMQSGKEAHLLSLPGYG